MSLPDDLKSYRADAFALFTEEEAGWALFLLFLVCLVLDRLYG